MSPNTPTEWLPQSRRPRIGRRLVGVLVAVAALCTLTAGTADAATWWRPSSAHPLRLQWYLSAPLNTANPVQMGLRDLNGRALPAPNVYDIDGFENTAKTVATLHRRGARVICYIDAGGFESYRPDAKRFPRSVIGRANTDFPDVRWLDVRQINTLKPIMLDRMRMCKAKGFDGIEPDEMDGYANTTGFRITAAQQLAYNRALAGWAHSLGLSVGQKGDVDQAASLVHSFDWTLNEQCHQYAECAGLSAYTRAGKAVWIAEYLRRTAARWASICAVSTAKHWNTARYKVDLNGGRTPCPGSW